MKRLIFLPLILIFVVSCGNTQTDNQIKQNADAAENFIYLVLNEPDEAKKLMHDDFTFRYMGKIPVYAQGTSVIKKSYNKETYFKDFLEVVGALLPGGIVLTPLDVIADEDSAAVIMVGDAEGAYGEYDNEYVFTFKFKDGKIIEVDEYNSDVLVVEALYGNTLWPNSSPPLLEYFWHTKGPNYSEENFLMLVEKWNERIDKTSCSINNASVLTPKVQNENFDFLWMLVWPSEEARDACYSEWLSDHEDGWQEDIAGIMSNDIDTGAFLFSQEVGRFPKSWNDSDTFSHTYYFCNFNEGSDANTLHDYRADLNAISDFSENHWYTLLEPMFEPEMPADFVWLDMWSSDETKASDLEIWNSTDLPKRAADMVTCGTDGITGIDFDGVSVRD
jgi:ketosteroid isomerase-like protein